jgi:hypothetical protein
MIALSPDGGALCCVLQTSLHAEAGWHDALKQLMLFPRQHDQEVA